MSTKPIEAKPFVCGECCEVFDSKDQLADHLSSVHGTGLVICQICREIFSTEEEFVAHNAEGCGAPVAEDCDGNVLLCTECGEGFTTEETLNQHLLTHRNKLDEGINFDQEPEGSHQCATCGEKFKQSIDLELHMFNANHHQNKPKRKRKVHQCEMCQKILTTSKGMRKHMLIHTGEKPFQCSECKKCFRQKGSLTTHMRTHTGDRPYPCGICEQSFTTSSCAKKHMRTHTGETIPVSALR